MSRADLAPDLLGALAELAAAPTLLVALDFDGTLSHLVPVPDQARPAPGVLDALGQLHDLPGTHVVLVSGRARADLARVSGASDVAELIGSHGQEAPGSQAALTPTEAARLAGLQALLEPLVARVAGARLEPKPAGFAVHIRNAEPDAGESLVAVTTQAAKAAGLATMPGKAVIEVSVRAMSKGEALHDYRTALGDPPAMFAGDDVTDESAMSALGPDALTIKVGEGPTGARFRVSDPDQMSALLSELARLRAAAQV